ncbi:hypothetical protein [Anabaena catenula]|uniref:Uncharacterized protein n=1 Tax=Anabaena catenula FACHB-362 TaxID=2692877 RepID=A0ABR8J184_9NOST|nr:hypothetical protein [Anabaena catenula]MBD2691204.1 hypothetical protein [Anabaena catenula FACHB-362]
MNEKTELEEITSNGFHLEESGNGDIDLAFLSLRIALKAYFSTYQCFNGLLYQIIDEDDKDWPDELRYYNQKENLKYREAYAECIVHFHHFAELVCKNFLHNENPLLIRKFKNEKFTQEKYIDREDISEYIIHNKQTVNFSDAIDRLVKFINAKRLKNYQQLLFLVDNQYILKKLGDFRNQVWHRGLYILPYKDLDKFIGKYVLQFVVSVTQYLHNLHNLHTINTLNCGIDPITEIINHFRKDSYNIEKIAFLKELGRAAYNAPLYWYGQYKDAKETMEKTAIVISKENDDSEICKCPVCGFNSLIIHKCVEYELDEYGEYESESSYPIRVKCECCSFELHNDISNASEYGIEGIRDYWV